VFKVAEVYEKQAKIVKQRDDGSEYASFEKVYDTRDCLINPAYVVSVNSHEFDASSDAKRLIGKLPPGAQFSVLVLDGNSFRSSQMIVEGSFEKFCALFEVS
jgi:hypothetical protein